MLNSDLCLYFCCFFLPLGWDSFEIILIWSWKRVLILRWLFFFFFHSIRHFGSFTLRFDSGVLGYFFFFFSLVHEFIHLSNNRVRTDVVSFFSLSDPNKAKYWQRTKKRNKNINAETELWIDHRIRLLLLFFEHYSLASTRTCVCVCVCSRE